MLYNDLIFDLSIKEDLKYPKMKAVQGDTKAYRFIVSLKDIANRKRIPFDVTASNLVTFTFLKEDGNSVVGQGTFVDKVKGIVQYITGTQEIAFPGKVKATIELFTSDGIRLTSTQFQFTVVKQLNDGTGVESATEYTALQQALVDVNSLQFEEDTRKTNESLRIDNETLRIQRTIELEQVSAVQFHERQNEFDTQLAQIVSYVKDFGAVGDGLQDDAPAIQSALDFVDAKGGGTVRLTEGIYLVKHTLFIGSNTALVGDGKNTIIKGEYSPATLASTISNKRVSTHGGYSAGENIVIKNINIKTNQNGIGLGHVNDVLIEGIYSNDNTTAHHLIDLSSCNNVTIKNCHFENKITNDIIQLDNSIEQQSLRVINPDYTTSNIFSDGVATQNIIIKDCYIDKLGTFLGGCITAHRFPIKNITIENNILKGGHAGVWVQGGENENYIIKNNVISQLPRSTNDIPITAANLIAINATTFIGDCIIVGNRLTNGSVDILGNPDNMVFVDNIINTYYKSNTLTGKNITIKNNQISSHKNDPFGKIVTTLRHCLRVDNGDYKKLDIVENVFDNTLGDRHINTSLFIVSANNDISIDGNTFLNIGVDYDTVLRTNAVGSVLINGNVNNLRFKNNNVKNSNSGLGFLSGTLIKNVDVILNNFTNVSHPILIRQECAAECFNVSNNRFNGILAGIHKNNFNKTVRFDYVKIKDNVYENINGTVIHAEGTSFKGWVIEGNIFLSGNLTGYSNAVLFDVNPHSDYLSNIDFLYNKIYTVNNKVKNGAEGILHYRFIRNEGGLVYQWGGTLGLKENIIY